jgi:hypothetical protein
MDLVTFCIPVPRQLHHSLRPEGCQYYEDLVFISEFGSNLMLHPRVGPQAYYSQLWWSNGRLL